jgi:hypothetical protein
MINKNKGGSAKALLNSRLGKARPSLRRNRSDQVPTTILQQLSIKCNINFDKKSQLK